MTKRLSIIIIAAAIMLASCVSGERNRLRLMLEQVNKECPVNLGEMGVFESIGYDENENTVVFTYDLNEEHTNIASLARANEQQKQFMANFLKRDGNEQKFLEQMVKADANLKCVYRGSESRDSVILFMSAAELRDIAAADVDEDNDLRQLESMVAISNAQCPHQLDEGLTMSSAAMEGDYIVFSFSYDPEFYEFHELDSTEFHKLTSEALREELTSPTGRSQLKLMKDRGIGAKYVYTSTDTSIAPVEVVLEPSEVAEY